MNRQTLYSIVKNIIILLIFWFVGYRLVVNIRQLDWSLISINWFYLTLAMILNMVYFIAIMDAWRLLMVGLGSPLSYSEGFRIWFVSNMGKYMPGKFWFVMGRYQMCGKMGVPLLVTTASMFLELILLILSGLILFFLCHRWLSDNPFSMGTYLFVLIAGFASIHPALINWSYALLCKLRKKEPRKIPMSYTRLLLILLYYTLAWFFYGVGCWLTAKSLSLSSHFMVSLGAFPFAWIVGYVSFVTPGGLGVREETTVILLKGLMGNAQASLLTVAVRILWTLAETFCFIITLFQRKNNEPAAK